MAEAKVLGPDGKPVEVEKVRRTLGFVPQLVKAENESEPPSGLTPQPGSATWRWYDW